MLDVNDPSKMICEFLVGKYHDYVLHTLDGCNPDKALAFTRCLSFVTGESLDGLVTPTNIQPFVIKDERGTWAQVMIGGQLTRDQNLEIRRAADELRIPCNSICCADEGTLTQQEFLQAALQLQATRPSLTKKWWQIWK